MLNVIETGTDTGAPPLLIAHGLFGSARNWGVIAKRLGAEGRRVLAVDMRNHGQSPWYESHDYPEMAGDLARVIESYGQMDVLGHSMGGKAAMVLALTRPELLRKLIVADIAPVAYGHTQSHNIEAMRRVPLDRIESRAQAAETLAIDEPDVAAFLLQSLDMAERRWRLNLDVLEREMHKIVGWPGVEGRFDGPALFLSGGASDYVTREVRPAVRQMFPAATFVSIPDAGHWLHAQKPREFEAALSAFLDAD